MKNKVYLLVLALCCLSMSLSLSASVWVPIQSTSELKTNDVVILAFEDGNGGGNSYLLYAKSGETAGFLQKCTYNSATKQFSIEPTNFYYHTVTANDDGTYKLKNQGASYGLELFSVATTEINLANYINSFTPPTGGQRIYKFTEITPFINKRTNKKT